MRKNHEKKPPKLRQGISGYAGFGGAGDRVFMQEEDVKSYISQILDYLEGEHREPEKPTKEVEDMDNLELKMLGKIYKESSMGYNQAVSELNDKIKEIRELI